MGGGWRELSTVDAKHNPLRVVESQLGCGESRDRGWGYWLVGHWVMGGDRSSRKWVLSCAGRSYEDCGSLSTLHRQHTDNPVWNEVLAVPYRSMRAPDRAVIQANSYGLYTVMGPDCAVIQTNHPHILLTNSIIPHM